jgi:hypothetical protein
MVVAAVVECVCGVHAGAVGAAVCEAICVWAAAGAAA